MKIGIAYLEYNRRKGIERISARGKNLLVGYGHGDVFHCVHCMDLSVAGGSAASGCSSIFSDV